MNVKELREGDFFLQAKERFVKNLEQIHIQSAELKILFNKQVLSWKKSMGSNELFIKK